MWRSSIGDVLLRLSGFQPLPQEVYYYIYKHEAFQKLIKRFIFSIIITYIVYSFDPEIFYVIGPEPRKMHASATSLLKLKLIQWNRVFERSLINRLTPFLMTSEM